MLLRPSPKGTNTQVMMVTLPSKAEDDDRLTQSLLVAGMDVARVWIVHMIIQRYGGKWFTQSVFLLSAVRDPMLSSDGSGRPKEGPHTVNLESRTCWTLWKSDRLKTVKEMSSLLLMCGCCQVRWLWPQNPQWCRTFLIPLLFLCYQRTKKVEEAFTWWSVEVLRSGKGLMNFIWLLTRVQKLEFGLNSVKPRTCSHQELNFLLFLTMPRCKAEKVHMAPKFQKLKKQVIILKTGDTPLVLARESICDGPALLTDKTGKIITLTMMTCTTPIQPWTVWQC
jgi:hypothetical protein